MVTHLKPVLKAFYYNVVKAPEYTMYTRLVTTEFLVWLRYHVSLKSLPCNVNRSMFTQLHKLKYIQM